ncbi:MAG TPA: CHAD domain-containing protein [Epsilonproteobacteria bacterium]|nr:CHAD domain-containing protein [Campylobacterota bacterium]
MMNELEIERKFLLSPCSMKRFLKKNAIDPTPVAIEQFYLLSTAASTERYRRKGEHYIHTLKRGGGLVREEHEEEVSAEEYRRKKSANSGGVIEKIRYRFDVEERIFELDAFRGVLKGLNVLEVEFGSEEEARSFELPAYFQKILISEVTENPAFTNGAISRSMRIPTIETDLEEMLRTVEKKDDFLQASLKVDLTAYESRAHALKILIFSLAKSVEANAEAIRGGDKAPQRLHQLRVAMRKIRAILSQLGFLFDEEWLQTHKTRLSELMAQTGPKRDVDVYLLEIKHYKTMIEPRHHKGIGHLEAYLLTLQEKLERDLVASLGGDAFREELEALFDFSRDPSLARLRDPLDGPILLSIKPSLRKIDHKVRKNAAKLDTDSDAQAYHAVRIKVKKLRYMMEFFASLFEREAYTEMLKQLKTIQTILGEHQDLQAQRMHLKEFAALPQLHDKTTRKAIDALRHEMKKLEIKKRGSFRAAYKSFARTERLFRRMMCRF